MRRLEGWSNTAACLAGWRRVTPQVWFCMWWTGRSAFLFLTVPVALTGAARLRAGGISSCCYIVNVQYITIRHELHHARKAWSGTLADHAFSLYVTRCKDTEQKIRRKKNTPRKETARPQSQFLYSYICERFIYSHDRCTYSAAGKYICEPIVGLYKSSQIYKFTNWDWGRAVWFLEIQKSYLLCSGVCFGVSTPYKCTFTELCLSMQGVVSKQRYIKDVRQSVISYYVPLFFTKIGSIKKTRVSFVEL